LQTKHTGAPNKVFIQIIWETATQKIARNRVNLVIKDLRESQLNTAQINKIYKLKPQESAKMNRMKLSNNLLHLWTVAVLDPSVEASVLPATTDFLMVMLGLRKIL